MYRKGEDSEERKRRREARELREAYEFSLLEYGQMSESSMKEERIETSAKLWGQLKKAFPYMPSDVLYSKKKAAIAFYDIHTPEWRDFSRARQAALIDLFVLRGSGFFGKKTVIDAINQHKFIDLKSMILLSPWPGQDNDHTVFMARQIETGMWQ